MKTSGARSIGGVAVVAVSIYLAHSMSIGDRGVFLPGDTSAGHHQIEERCELCHSESFADADTIQEACVGCHGAALERVDDSHPRSKFTDPRNADRVAGLDARYCATCHREHAPRTTRDMGLTLPEDYCFHCHADIASERPSHAALAFDGCSASGCHNFHDNGALYEDFLLAHATQPPLLERASVRERTPIPRKAPALSLAAADAPRSLRWRPSAGAVWTWASASHARAGVNCSDCHAPNRDHWSIQVAASICGDCHVDARAGFEAGRHGMRLAAGLDPMRPARARIPMRVEAAERRLDCTACHGAHQFDVTDAAVEACLSCHADDHSQAYEQSPHGRLTREGGDDASTVTCATCHMPRLAHGDGRVRVQHDQSRNLRPSERMAREVCLECHGLGFSLDALADAALVARNFAGSPAIHVPSIDWAVSRSVPARAASTGSPSIAASSPTSSATRKDSP